MLITCRFAYQMFQIITELTRGKSNFMCIFFSLPMTLKDAYPSCPLKLDTLDVPFQQVSFKSLQPLHCLPVENLLPRVLEHCFQE